MRLLVALSLMALAFAGCTAPTEQPDPLFGVCPQWLDGDAKTATVDVIGAKDLAFPEAIDHSPTDLILDRYRIIISDIVVDGSFELRASAAEDGRALRFTDYRSPSGTTTPVFLALDAASGTVEVDIFLTDVTHGADPAPTALRLDASSSDGASGSFHVDVTPGYRVCGVVS